MLAMSPFRLPVPSRLKFLQPLLERLLGLSYLDRLYRQRVHTETPKDFVRVALRLLGLRYTSTRDIVDSVPAEGSLVVVANHPFGGAEGLAIIDLLLKVRPDTRVLANQVLNGIPELRELFIGVDILGTQNRRRANREAIERAREWVQGGGVLLVFPAGEVASWNWKKRRVTEAPWRTTAAAIIRETGASVLPVFVAGNNSRLFHMLGVVHPALRTLRLVRELINKRGQIIQLSPGKLITPSDRRQLNNDKALTNFLRLNTLLLREHTTGSENQAATQARTLQPLIEPVPQALLAEDISQLMAERRLLEKGEMEVWCASATELPHILKEIGRLRELTFRIVGEGTGYEMDVDQYDRDYLHLFLWHKSRQEIVGAYRLGLVDRLYEQQGLEGIYSRSLFQYDATFLKKLGGCLEMGRSFVRPEYQKSITALMFLWKGIGAFIVKHPQYRILFGPVSISNDYSELSRQLMASCLQANNYDKTLADLVRPTAPLADEPTALWDPDHLEGLSHVEGLSLLIQTIEKDKGVPILIKHYLKLQGEFAGFNVDKNFNNALDGLIVVDLKKVDDRMLGKYLGNEGMVLFRNRHGYVTA
ncbi:GNAT family N-acetyltransferase [Kistimonas scapharcae]|uniref:L-ornithine N(alpha)-acyltransferase n=1 Tax=Kistimonas scapharcae TaxID=1036133 RepID=A0ABP8UZ46_9GAMM